MVRRGAAKTVDRGELWKLEEQREHHIDPSKRAYHREEEKHTISLTT